MSGTKDHFVVVADESPASRTLWIVKHGPLTQDDAEDKADLLNERSERRYYARSGPSLNVFPHMFRDDRDVSGKAEEVDR